MGFDLQALFYWAISKELLILFPDMLTNLNIDPRDDGNHALIIDTGIGNLRIVRYLVPLHGVDPHDGTALYVTGRKGHKEVAEYLRNYQKYK